MTINFNANIKLLIGGSYCGGENWNKTANDIDNCFKLYYLREGIAEVYGKGGTFRLEAPNLYFINGYHIESQKCIEKIVVDWLHFHPESVYFDYILRYGNCVSKLDFNQFNSYAHIFKKFNPYFLNRMNEFDQRISTLEFQSFIQLAIAKVFENSDQKLFDDDSNFIRLLPALEYINTNYTKEVNLKHVADVCFLSPNYFHRIFTQTFNKSPLEYIRQMRMEEALRQLTYTTKAVKEISYAIGYEDDAYFSRTFSKIYGISPGKYRKDHCKKMP